MAGGELEPIAGHSVPRKRPNFSARTALEDGSRLDPADAPAASERSPLIPREQPARPRELSAPLQFSPPSPSRGYGAVGGWFGRLFGKEHIGDQEAGGQQGGHGVTIMRRASLSSHTTRSLDVLDKKEKTGPAPPSDDVSEKLGTFSGVFVPTSLNVLSILMFLRFGFVLGQSGVLAILGEFSMKINLSVTSLIIVF